MNAPALSSVGLVWLLCVGCGGATQSAAAPVDPEPQVTAPKPAPDPIDEPVAESAPPEAAPEAPPAVEPAFTEGMTVDQAIKAVPEGTPRLNLDPEVLGRPLGEFSLYEPCKPSAKQKWTVRVAIWQGKPVGVDVETSPKNDKFAACAAARVRTVEWKDQVPSLNTVETSF